MLRVEARHRLGALALDVALEVAPGECLALAGPSGAGKTSVLRIAAGLVRPERGLVEANGETWLDTERDVDVPPERRRCGYVFQEYALFPHLSAWQNVAYPLRDVPRRERRDRALELLERFGLAEKRDDYPDRLSGGQQQRVAIARALAMRPRVLLLDEVTSALDPELVAEVLNVIRELAAQGMTMLIATHEMAFARDIANRVCFLDAGVILEEGPPNAIFSSPRHPRTQQFLQRIIDAGRL